ncbi:hypothetical protein [Levilactobacillus brevis]|uniref:Uncharacterized protein n=1 Tax=Levilactobacillus brevis TaxID=1580 RepID=A0AAJ5FKI2_LEVBR|nr:hypothetical protein [Levilactobacillus brevis]MCT3565992.1 hypothetical protein [Levilactobacillus brevis]MDA0410815.1 hypothetical protein [Levilactobacillus brevis]RAY08469.1 hypothetical protein DN391_11210 [Levilactobacillus brevis]TOZ05557.1 hypothetical protein DIS17_02565 [Levilactobacillus brevis]HJD99158.1 hypothetical protein [Levilactobacillus brevis]
MDFRKRCALIMIGLSLSGGGLSSTTAFATTTAEVGTQNEINVKSLPIALLNKRVSMHMNRNAEKLIEAVRLLDESGAVITPEQKRAVLVHLVQKYDGAQVDYDIRDDSQDGPATRGHSFSEKWVNGGLNDFAGKKSALPELRSYYGKTAASSALIGAGGGATVGGLPGAIIGAIGGQVAYTRFNDAQNDMKRWIRKDSSKGGCRVTATDEFPIASLGSQKQAKIQKL